jgi:hypothetical protein
MRLVRISLALAVALTAGSAGLVPARASAAACADFSNQAAAQRAANTRDADVDGVYCERLPCPCLKPGRSNTGTRGSGLTSPSSADELVKGRCPRGVKADPRCTPGAAVAGVTRSQVCSPGYSSGVRNVSQGLKDRVSREYGILSHRPREYEVDHLISLELGGSNSPKNLWPELYTGPRGARAKDGLENALHAELCRGQLTVAEVQRKIVSQWTTGASHISHRQAARGRRVARRRPGSARRPPSKTDATSPNSADHSAKKSSGSPVLGPVIVIAIGLVSLRYFVRRRRRR